MTRVPTILRYRGRDLIWWLADMRLDQVTPEERGPARLGPVISGAYGGRTIDFRNFAADGMILVGRIEAAHHGVIEIAPGLAESMADGDLVYTTDFRSLYASIAQEWWGWNRSFLSDKKIKSLGIIRSA